MAAMNENDEKTGFRGWAILEVFGHRKLGGMVEFSPPELPGLIRIDVIAESDTPLATQYYGASAVFCLTPCTETMARRLAAASEIRPVTQWELPAPVSRIDRIGDDDRDEIDDDEDEDEDRPF